MAAATVQRTDTDPDLASSGWETFGNSLNLRFPLWKLRIFFGLSFVDSFILSECLYPPGRRQVCVLGQDQVVLLCPPSENSCPFIA